jgi:hypothetical protein
MNTVSQTIAKLIILPLFGAAVITGVALGTSDSAAAASEFEPLPPATTTTPAQPGLIEDAIWDGEMAPTAPAAPARPDVILNGIRVDAVAPAPVAPAAPAPVAPAPAAPPAAPADNARSGKQDSGPSDKKKKDSAKSSKGDSSRK